MKRIAYGLLADAFLTGCGHQQMSPLKSRPKPVVPISISSVSDITVDTYLARDLKHPVNSVDVSNVSEERKIVDELNSSESVPLPTPGTKVVAPAIEPTSISYKVTVWIRNGTPRIFKIDSWGPTHDVVYNEDLSPGLSRNVMKEISPVNAKQK